MKQQMEAARAEGQQLIAQAREVADRFREEELTKARKEIGIEKSKAQANIQREREAAIEELRRQFAGLAVSTARRIIERELDEAGHRDLIEKALAESSEIPRT
jgi:F-type H+-transporting ATPase subunit b